MRHKRIIALLIISALLLSGCSDLGKKRGLTYTDTLFDTVIKVQIFDAVDEDVIKGCEKLCKDFDAKFSRTNENSEISKINHAGGAPVEVSNETITLIKKGLYYSELSAGVFDITIAPVADLWDFKAETPALPDGGAISEAVSHVNYENIIIKNNTVTLTDPSAGIDVGAVAKGYIADQLKKYLKDQGVKHALINLGGNVLAVGTKPDGTAYNIGIQKPFKESGEPITSVKITDQSMVTSGVYQRYFELDGKIYHHILNPATGYPAENTLSSVTIITNSSLTADALSTTCFLLGLEKGMELIDKLDNVDAVFITNDNKVHYSRNFQK